MDILFRSKKFAKECNQQELLVKRHGAQRAKLIRRRLDELRAAANLEVMRALPQARCHELKGNRKGQLSVDLDHPYRLLFKPDQDPLPEKPEGGLDWGKVSSIEILGVEDTHG
ncbi:type II toxin-antitoxin system RelE/ParE family toxin [Syntrophobacter fumaroxidans]|nr:type II toxin-antitoxin system RelE/ParE family toxin [Syntrophobacter fumaroxidans]